MGEAELESPSSLPRDKSAWDTVINAEDKKLADYWLSQAEASLSAARRELAAGELNFCVNRLYYAAFYAASGVLAARGQTYSKHAAVRAALHRDLVRPGLIEPHFGELYNRLFADRHDADYVAFTTFDPERLSGELEQVEAFLSSLRQTLEQEP